MIVLMQTDLPEPVAPAISTWGIFAISAMTGAPEMPLPSATAVGDCHRPAGYRYSVDDAYVFLYQQMGVCVDGSVSFMAAFRYIPEYLRRYAELGQFLQKTKESVSLLNLNWTSAKNRCSFMRLKV